MLTLASQLWLCESTLDSDCKLEHGGVTPHKFYNIYMFQLATQASSIKNQQNMYKRS